MYERWLLDFLNINIESMRDQYPESNDWECLMKMLTFWYLLLYLGAAIRTIWFYSCKTFIYCRELQPFLIKYLLIKVFVSMYQKQNQYFILTNLSPKTNLTRKTLKLVTVCRRYAQNLLPWPTSFKTPRYTLIPESRF